MALKANETAVAIAVQSAPGTWTAPTAADLLPVANLSLDFAGVTVANPEYTGSVHRSGDAVSGKTVSLKFEVMLRPPGGAAPPALGAFIPGRLMRAAKMIETRLSAPIPAAPEALANITNPNTLTLGAGAAATDGLYTGLALLLTANGARPKAMTAIRSYKADKAVVLPEPAATSAGNYQIPAQLAYQRDISSAEAVALSIKVWLGGRRYDLFDCAVSSLEFPIPVATRDGAELPKMIVTLSADLYDYSDEATPAIPTLGAIPLFKDGDFWVANKAVGGSSLSLNMGLKSAAAPNPNRQSGSDPSQLVEVKPSLSLSLNAYLKAQFDTIAMADAQAQHAVWAQWGYSAGGMVSVLVTDARFNYRTSNIGSDLITDEGDMLIDVADKNITICFAY